MQKCTNKCATAALFAVCGHQQSANLRFGNGAGKARKAAVRQIHCKLGVIRALGAARQTEKAMHQTQKAV